MTKVIKIGKQERERYDVHTARLLVKSQAINHTRRTKEDPLIKETRPNEPDLVYKYRNSIKRMLTKDGIDRGITKICRILESKALTLDHETLNQNTKDWFDSEMLTYMDQYCGMKEYALRVIVPDCIEDPNAIHVIFPENPINEGVPLSYSEEDGGMPQNIFPLITARLIPVEDIIEATAKMFSYFGDEIEVKYRDQTKMERLVWEHDPINIWMLVPFYNKKLELEYRRVLWYFTNYQFPTLNYAPGRTTKAEDGNYYNESYYHSYFEGADEFVSAFSDLQAAMRTHLYAKVVVNDLVCPAKGCKDGKIHVVDKEGNKVVEKCGNCSGTGIIRDPGPYGVLNPKTVTVGGEDLKNNLPIQYVTPPTGNFQVAWEKTFEILERAEASIGLDVLLKMQESSLAMDRRLEDLEDMLKDFGTALIECLEVLLRQVDALLNKKPESRKAPKFIRPQRYDVKGELGYKLDYENSLPFDRYSSALQAVQSKYRGDSVKQKIYEVAFKYAPVLLLSDVEFLQRVSSGAYGDLEILKRDYTVIWLFDYAQSKNEMSFIGETYESIAAFLDAKFAGITPEPVVVPAQRDDNGEIIE